MNQCECGCGKYVKRRFAAGHNGRGENNSRWKGGRRASIEGYIYVWLHPADPFFEMAQKGGQGSQCYVLEHRLVMARSLGRPLHPDEVVHHRNRDRADNRIENLELLPSKSAHGSIHYPPGRQIGAPAL